MIELCGFRFSIQSLTRMTQSWSFSPGKHIPLQNKKKLAHPTRFERVIFAFGGQRSIYAARRGMALSTNRKNRVLRAPTTTPHYETLLPFSLACDRSSGARRRNQHSQCEAHKPFATLTVMAEGGSRYQQEDLQVFLLISIFGL